MSGPALADFEKLGAFYLGRRLSPPEGEPFLVDARDLTTHGVVVGMTGSGKTGLSIALLEEAAIDGVPAIVIDPKGDLGNLSLTFPRLAAEDFAPWAPHGTLATDEAAKWQAGLEAWGQDGARIARLRDAAEVVLYTPGSRSGRPISILGSLVAPSLEQRADKEALGERITDVATSLLGLVGHDGDGGKSREHVLLATILEKAWSAGEDLDLAGLVLRIQTPPFDTIGVLALDAFYPQKERFELAVAYNALLAAPGFDAWLDGPPLDVARLLWSKEGKPRISVISIAHLDDAERMFFVSLLLGEIVAWMRTQPGTPSLRALLFIDEIVGYLPPVAMPPSKRPLLLLLKQARAFGLGVVLATQNPVDLDYKALANAGTWIIGRLQTERDKERVLDGLEGAAQGAFSRADVDRAMSALGKRQFYVHDVHASGPAIIESRWTMSYLRGPLTKEEIKRLANAGPEKAPAPAPVAPAESGARPAVPPDVPQVFFPTTVPAPVYAPMVVGAASVHFEDAKTGLSFAREVVFVTPFVDGPLPVRWEDAKWAGGIDVRALGKEPAPNARFSPLASVAQNAKSYSAWSKELAKWLARTQGVARLKAGRVYSSPNEDERSFRARLSLASREERDGETAKVREKYTDKLAALEERIRKKQDAVQRGEEAASAGKVNAFLGVGGGIFGAFLGRPTANKIASGVARGVRSANRAADAGKRAEREKEGLDVLLAKYRDLQSEAQQALADVTRANDPASLALETVVTKPKKTGITIHLVALAWRA